VGVQVKGIGTYREGEEGLEAGLVNEARLFTQFLVCGVEKLH
jgi:hypothetical protein